MSYKRIVISSGHGKYVPGAIGILDEHAEAVRVVDVLADMLAERGVAVTTFEDTVSRSQNENLNRIVDFHNSQARDLDVSVHFNAYVETDKPMGTECLYVTQSGLAREIANAIATCGFVNRGPKQRTDLFFLNNTAMPSILIEVCFVDSAADAGLYDAAFADLSDVKTPYVEPCNESIFNQYTLRVARRDALQSYLKERGIGNSIYYPLPLHLQPCFGYLGYKPGSCPESERAAGEVLSLPIFPELTQDQLDEVITAVRAFYGR